MNTNNIIPKNKNEQAIPPAHPHHSTQKYQFPVSHLDKTETKNYRIFDKTEMNI